MNVSFSLTTAQLAVGTMDRKAVGNERVYADSLSPELEALGFRRRATTTRVEETPEPSQKTSEARARSIVRAMRDTPSATVQRPDWRAVRDGFVYAPATDDSSPELVGFPEALHAAAFPPTAGPRSRAGSPARSTASVVSPASLDRSTAESVALWRNYNQLRVTRLQEGCDVSNYMNGLANCLEYLHRPLEPIARLEVCDSLVKYASKIQNHTMFFVAAKLRWGEQYMFGQLSKEAQRSLVRNEENEVRNQRYAYGRGDCLRRSGSRPPVVRRRERSTQRPPTPPNYETPLKPSDSDEEDVNEWALENAEQYVPRELLDDSFDFERGRERNKQNKWNASRM